MKLSTTARAKLQQLEGFSAKAYIPVPGDVPTIGYGFTRGVSIGDTMSREEADHRLINELRKYEEAVSFGCTSVPNQNQFDAMVLLCFNIGVNGFLKSTVLRCHNKGDYQAAARAFGLWNKSSGVVYAGLTRRRAEEAALYLTPTAIVVADSHPEMPQTIDAETPMTASPINRAGVLAGGTATVAAVSEASRLVADVKSSVTGMGDWMLPVLLIAVVGLCGYVVWTRLKQREGGWA